MRLLTVADIDVLPDSLPSGDVRWELHDGRPVANRLATADHGLAHANVMFQLCFQGDRRGHGQSTGRVAVVLRRGPDHVLTPDATHRRTARCPPRLTPEGFLDTMPDLIVEIQDRHESAEEMRCRTDDYLAAGVAVVWVINPVAQGVIESRQGGQRRVFGENDTLTIDDVIPGFRLPVRDVFA